MPRTKEEALAMFRHEAVGMAFNFFEEAYHIAKLSGPEAFTTAAKGEAGAKQIKEMLALIGRVCDFMAEKPGEKK